MAINSNIIKVEEVLQPHQALPGAVEVSVPRPREVDVAVGLEEWAVEVEDPAMEVLPVYIVRSTFLITSITTKGPIQKSYALNVSRQQRRATYSLAFHMSSGQSNPSNIRRQSVADSRKMGRSFMEQRGMLKSK